MAEARLHYRCFYCGTPRGWPPYECKNGQRHRFRYVCPPNCGEWMHEDVGPEPVAAEQGEE